MSMWNRLMDEKGGRSYLKWIYHDVMLAYGPASDPTFQVGGPSAVWIYRQEGISMSEELDHFKF